MKDLGGLKNAWEEYLSLRQVGYAWFLQVERS